MRALAIIFLLLVESSLRRVLRGPGWWKVVARWLLLGYDEKKEDPNHD